jgi:hypothetical protein
MKPLTMLACYLVVVVVRFVVLTASARRDQKRGKRLRRLGRWS